MGDRSDLRVWKTDGRLNCGVQKRSSTVGKVATHVSRSRHQARQLDCLFILACNWYWTNESRKALYGVVCTLPLQPAYQVQSCNESLIIDEQDRQAGSQSASKLLLVEWPSRCRCVETVDGLTRLWASASHGQPRSQPVSI